MKVTRRQFLHGSALIAAAALFAPAHRFLLAQDTPADALAAYLAAMETPYAAPLNEHFETVIQRNNIGLLLYDLSHARLLTALAPENPLPVASAFKAPLLMCFLDLIDPSVWSRLPVEHWIAPSASQVPEDWREDWEQHNGVLRALYQTLVISDNAATGQVLSYIARAQGRLDPLALFNDWARDRVGVSQLSGLSGWSQGIDSTMSAVDARYEGRGTNVGGQMLTFENLMTPRDLGLFYVWMYSRLSQEGQRVARALLSTIRDNRGANLERMAQEVGGTPYSKNGSMILDERTIITDAGLITQPEGVVGTEFLVVFLSLDAPTLVPTVFEELGHTLRGRYNEILQNRRNNAVDPAALRAAYAEHLATAYPQQAGDGDEGGLYRYGFIIPEGVQVYADPADAEPLRNPIIRSTRFGVHLLMQGALVRYVEVDQTWLELMPDDQRDNVRVRLGYRIFVRREDVWPVPLRYSQPIPRLSNQEVALEDKFIVIQLEARELVAFEGAQPVLRVPIILNADATPRGAHAITSKWFARSMQPWAPGVPFTSFFGGEGYALHGSPWQRWSTTVNQHTISARTSAGCVNLPDWMVQAGEFHRPADELLFRWIGGMENPQENVFDYPSDAYPALRIYNVDYAEHMRSYVRPVALQRANATWDDIIAGLSALPLQAPESFFV